MSHPSFSVDAMVMNKDKAAAQALGVSGEDAVAAWYRKAGFTILERNWRCFEGEIDIIAKRGRTVVVCEVKARRASSRMDPALAITPAKQARVRTAAFRWLEQQNATGRVRFDVALVVDGRVQIIEGAF